MPVSERGCPDDGACHHECGDGPCFRVLHCEPLSASGWKRWPGSIRRLEGARRILANVEQDRDAR